MEAALLWRPLSDGVRSLFGRSLSATPLSVWLLTVGGHSLIVGSRSLCQDKFSVGCRSLLEAASCSVAHFRWPLSDGGRSLMEAAL
jgi:hypothetical protein